MTDGSERVDDETERFRYSCLYRIGSGTFQGTALGLFAGSIILSWYPDPYRFDVKGTVVPKPLNLSHIVKGLRVPTLWSALACGTFCGVECIMEQLRDEKHESTWYNASIAGATTGLLIGSITKRFDIMTTSALGLGLVMGLIEQNGQHSPASQPSFTEETAEQMLIAAGVMKESSIVTELKEKYPEYKDL